MIAEFEYIHKGTYTCQANNSLGSDEASYTVGMSVIMTLYDQYCYSCFLKLCSSYYNMTYQSYWLIYRESVCTEQYIKSGDSIIQTVALDVLEKGALP